ncbi:hypothetical protein [Bacteroides sp.]|uniref:hypothetical protein n=1 Tax=Bacteroides sp. TaxID=29523 RepID=UPI0026234378|nr:hypothetical protein [Bacteroides sp.]MDD3041255.1 hypothetical protein [Bacteroides sp.]
MKKKPTIRKPIKTPVAVTYNRKKDYISYDKTINDQFVKPEIAKAIKKALPAKIVRTKTYPITIIMPTSGKKNEYIVSVI